MPLDGKNGMVGFNEIQEEVRILCSVTSHRQLGVSNRCCIDIIDVQWWIETSARLLPHHLPRCMRPFRRPARQPVLLESHWKPRQHEVLAVALDRAVEKVQQARVLVLDRRCCTRHRAILWPRNECQS
jgi:hypothetical protein